MIKTAVILAAGLGSRLKEMTTDKPKGFLIIGDKSIIEQSICKLIDHGVEKIIIGTGYLSDAYEQLAKKYPQIICVKNMRYSETGSMYTLYNLRNYVDNDFLLLESDLIYDKIGLRYLLEESCPDVVLASGRTNSNDEVYIEVDDNKFLVGVSKMPEELSSTYGELIGITKISINTFQKMCYYADNTFVSNQKLDYEYALVGISDEVNIYVKKIEDYAWSEIDDRYQLDRANIKIYPLIKQREEKMQSIKRNILLNPGPATTTDTVKYAQVVPDICPRENEFADILKDIRIDLVKIVHGGNDYASVLFTGSGTAAMDSAINSVVPPDKKIAIIVNGAYGERMVKIAKAYGIQCVEVNFQYGEKIDVAKVEKILKVDKDIACVAMVHHETTTGILNPIKEIGKISKENGCTFIVDAISSYAGIPININEYNIDFLMATSNKCIQGMAGVAFIICRKEELDKIKDYPKRSFYLDLYSQYKHLEETGQTQFTPPVQTIYALRQAIREYFEEGAENRYMRYTESWKVLRKGLLDMGFKLFLCEEDESHILLTLFEPNSQNYSFENMHDFLYERGFTIYPGKIGNKKTFRLANMGDIDVKDIKRFLVVLEEYIANTK